MDGVKVDAEKVCNALNFCLHGCTPLKVACPYYQEKPEGEDVCKDNLYHDAFDLISQLDKRCYEMEKALEAFKVGKLVHFGGCVDIPWQEETPERIEQEIKNIKDQIGNVLYNAGALKIIVKAGVHKDWPDTPATVGWKLTVEREAQDGDGTDRRPR